MPCTIHVLRQRTTFASNGRENRGRRLGNCAACVLRTRREEFREERSMSGVGSHSGSMGATGDGLGGMPAADVFRETPTQPIDDVAALMGTVPV